MKDARKEALNLLRAALKLLDESGAPLHIGAQLEFTIGRLEETVVDQSAKRYSSELT